MELVTLTEADKLEIARDALRGRESDYYRLGLLDAASNGAPDRMKALADEIVGLQNKVADMEKAKK